MCVCVSISLVEQTYSRCIMYYIGCGGLCLQYEVYCQCSWTSIELHVCTSN